MEGDNDYHDDGYTIPMQHQRVFGAGIKRKRIDFVRAADNPVSSSSAVSASSSSSSSSYPSAADKYLSIVLPKPANTQAETQAEADSQTGQKAPSNVEELEELEQDGQEQVVQCTVCRQPVLAATTQHESSIAHQVCLQHSKPPSHLNREHVGVKYLAAYGWDPDSGLGLGAHGEGIRLPIKAAAKNDTVGLRERDDDDDDCKNQKQKARAIQKEKAIQKQKKKGDERIVVRLNAKQVRKQEVVGKRRAEALRAAFYNDVDLDKYLNP